MKTWLTLRLEDGRITGATFAQEDVAVPGKEGEEPVTHAVTASVPLGETDALAETLAKVLKDSGPALERQLTKGKVRLLNALLKD